MTPPRISVVIPARDAADTITAQLDALAAQRGAPPVEVIVVDHRSRDATAAVARRRGAEHGLPLQVVRVSSGEGANVARNAGWRRARGELVLFLDADDRVHDGALAAVDAAFAADPGLGLASGVPTGEDPATFALPVTQGYLPYGISAFLVLRRTVLTDIGGFDEDFVRGHDEVDLCWRAQQAGHRLGIVRDARFTYVPRGRLRGAFTQYRRYGATSILLYVRHRHHGLAPASWRIELWRLLDLPGHAGRLLRGDGDRLELARGLGWAIGRWQGRIRYRTWGPR